MTLDQFSQRPELSAALKGLLSNPLLIDVLDMLSRSTMASRMAMNPASMMRTFDTSTMFGYDLGRASVFEDLKQLCAAPEVVRQPEDSYTSEKKPEGL